MKSLLSVLWMCLLSTTTWSSLDASEAIPSLDHQLLKKSVTVTPMSAPFTDFSVLSPRISEITLRTHYFKHQLGYVQKLNVWLKVNNVDELIGGRRDSSVVVALVLELPNPSSALNLASQIFNHALYFSLLLDSPTTSQRSSIMDHSDDVENVLLQDQPLLLDALRRSFGSLLGFRNEWMNSASSHFGSGWVWLVLNKTDELMGPHLAIVSTHDAGSVLDRRRSREEDGQYMEGVVPLLIVDVWEHAYYLDYQDRRLEYLDAWWECVNWHKVQRRLIGERVEEVHARGNGYPVFY